MPDHPVNARDLPYRILIVDDNPGDTLIMRNAIEGAAPDLPHPVEVHSALGGQQALVLLNQLRAQNHLPDIILLDLMMPEMDGYEFISRCQQDNVLKSISIVVVAGIIDDAARKKAEDLGASAAYEKLHDIEQMTGMFEEILPVWLVE